MQEWFRSELQQLYKAPLLFASDDPYETMRASADTLNEHKLVWRPGQVNSYLRELQIGDLSLLLLRYGAGVQVFTGGNRDFYLFQIPLSGAARITVGNTDINAHRGTGAIVSPNLPLQLEWSEGCEQLLLKVPQQKVQALARQMLRIDSQSEVVFNPRLDINSWQGHAWQHMLGSLMSCLRSPKTVSSRWLRAQEEMLVQHLLLSHSHNYSGLLDEPSQPRRRIVRLAEEYIETHLRAPLDIAGIAKAAGSSASSLSAAFRDVHGQSIMSYVREQRLSKVHAELITTAPGVRITDVALSWGFTHLGRFSAQYRARFGQTPSHTLRQ